MALAAISADAKITITNTNCNYQKGLAVCTGDIRLGWQMQSDVNDDKQTAYQILVTENVTGKKVYNSKKKKSEESQFITIPKLKQNRHGYLWKVRVWDKDGKPSEWSREQQIRIQTKSYPDHSNKGNHSPLHRGWVGGGASFIGAITKSAAKLPEGRFSNAEFKKDYFKEKWNPVDRKLLMPLCISAAWDTTRCISTARKLATASLLLYGANTARRYTITRMTLPTCYRLATMP